MFLNQPNYRCENKKYDLFAMLFIWKKDKGRVIS